MGLSLFRKRDDSMSELPILNYDPTQKAVINPFRHEGYHFPAKMLLAFVTPDHLADFYAEYHAQEIGTLLTFSNVVRVQQIRFHGEAIGICPAVIGAPASAQIIDFLIAYGAKQIIAVGSCGVLLDKPENTLLVVTEALRDEGTSYHYLPQRRVFGWMRTWRLPFKPAWPVLANRPSRSKRGLTMPFSGKRLR